MDRKNLTLTHVELNENLLLDIMLEQISDQEVGGKPLILENAVLTLQQGNLSLTSDITSPIKAGFSLTAIPEFNESNQMFDLKDIKVKIEAESLIYKLSAPLVNKFIESKLDAVFPVNLKELIENGVKDNLPSKIDSEYGTMQPKIEAIDISKLNIHNGLMKGILRIKNSNISIDLK